jgi:hypothetical protein
MSNECAVVDINMVKSRMLIVRDQPVLLDRDVAALYGVQTKEINQAVRNNPDKFPEGFLLQLNNDEFSDWKSKILTSNLSPAEKNAIKMGVRRAPKAFTERGLYMLATVLKGELATKATLAIVNTYAQVRSVKRELLELHNEGDKKKKHALMQHFGETLTDIVMPDPDEVETESSLELNFFIGKIKHTVRKIKKNH